MAASRPRHPPHGCAPICPPIIAWSRSPALRTRETAGALSSKVEVLPDLAPGADVSAILAAIDWPQGHEDTVVVGHQPWIGRLASLLLAGHEINWSVKKSGIWWLSSAHARHRGPGRPARRHRSRFPLGLCTQIATDLPQSRGKYFKLQYPSFSG